MERDKVIVDATLSELEDIGIDHDIVHHNGIITHDFETGWYEVEITYRVHNHKFTSKFDIPGDLLRKI